MRRQFSAACAAMLLLSACSQSPAAAPTAATGPTATISSAPTANVASSPAARPSAAVSAVPSPAAAVSPAPSPVAAVSPIASPSAAAGPGAQAALPAPSSPQVSGGKKIALLLPESQTTRYESQDRPDFQAELQKICSDCQLIYSNANQDAAAQQSQAEAALTNGANVLVLDPVDGAAAAVIADRAHQLNVPVIAYHRLISGSSKALTALNNRVDGVYAANDGTAGGAIAAMLSAGVSPWPPVTGQDAELAAIQRILMGQQYMTVYKAIAPEAQDAAILAFDLATNTSVQASATQGATTNHGSANVPSILLTPVSVTRSNIQSTVVADGLWTVAQICTANYVAACAQAGLQ